MQPMMNFAGVVQQRITLPGSSDQVETSVIPNGAGRLSDSASVEFSQLFDEALHQVTGLQDSADQMRTDYELGVSSDLVGTMIASEKASLSFQAVVQVRNRVVSAYETVFNMPV